MLALPGPASAETIQLGWTETYLYNGRANDRLFVFRVDSVTVTDRSWTVKGSVRNASALRMTIRNRFAVVAGGTAFPASRFSPRLPAELAIGARWHGSFGGRGRLPRATPLRIRFGLFRASLLPALPGLSWVTTHSFKLQN